MKKLAFIILPFISSLVVSNNANAWSNADTAWEIGYLATHIADWGQTRDIAAQCGQGTYYETNPALGRCPSENKVNAYFLGTALLHAGVAHLLPQKYRRTFQSATMMMQVGVISNNAKIGLNIKF